VVAAPLFSQVTTWRRPRPASSWSSSVAKRRPASTAFQPPVTLVRNHAALRGPGCDDSHASSATEDGAPARASTRAAAAETRVLASSSIGPARLIVSSRVDQVATPRSATARILGRASAMAAWNTGRSDASPAASSPYRTAAWRFAGCSWSSWSRYQAATSTPRLPARNRAASRTRGALSTASSSRRASGKFESSTCRTATWRTKADRASRSSAKSLGTALS
jgi:hypothetical protein